MVRFQVKSQAERQRGKYEVELSSGANFDSKKNYWVEQMADRIQFSRQPARVVLVLVRGGSDAEMCRKLSASMENFFALVCSMNGQCRLPFFGLIALGAQPEVLLPLQHVKGNFARLHSAICELKSANEELVGWASESCASDLSVVGRGIQEAVTSFQRQAQNLLQAAGYWSQLEITLFTTLSSKTVVQSVEPVIRHLDMNNFRKMQVVQVMDPTLCWFSEDVGSSSSQTSGPAEGVADISETIEILHIDSHPLSLQTFFMGWLHETANDNEHLHIVFESGFRLRCDLQQRILSPQCIPFHQDFILSCGSQSSKPLITTGGMRPDSADGCIHRLQVVGRVSVETVCDSLLFGNPLVVRATTCWKIDWDELELNQQHFQALCYLLNQQNEALIAKLTREKGDTHAAAGATVSGYPYSASAGVNCMHPPSGHFVLLPSPSCSLLLKSIGVHELLLPIDLPGLEKPMEENLSAVTEAVEKVALLPDYNPLQMSSGLFESLLGQLVRNLPKKPQAETRKQSIPTLPTLQQQKSDSLNVPPNRKRPYDSSTINRLKLSRGQPNNWPPFGFPTEL